MKMALRWSSLVKIESKFSVALCTVDEAKKIYRSLERSMHFFSLGTSSPCGGCFFSPLQISDMYRFSEMILDILRAHGKGIVACASKNDPKLLTNTCLLLGSYMILKQGAGLQEVFDAFHPLSDLFVEYSDPTPDAEEEQLAVLDCWRALCYVRSIGWLGSMDEIEFKRASSRTQRRPMLDLDECIHYADPLNGHVNFVVPEKILFFPAPIKLEANRWWTDVNHVRYFSAAYYADLFVDLNVSVVICLDKCTYDCQEFLSRGIEVEELYLHKDSPHLLQAVDRFLTVLSAVPGAVAVQCGADGPGNAGTLIASFLISHMGFQASSAVAWMRMMCPGLLVAQQHLSVFTEDTEFAGRQTTEISEYFARCFSAPHGPSMLGGHPLFQRGSASSVPIIL